MEGKARRKAEEEQSILVAGRRSMRDRSGRPVSSDKIGVVRVSVTPSRLGSKQRRVILAAYEKVPGLYSSAMKPASSLPYPKRVIRDAILEELTDAFETERTRLEIAYAQLEVFLESREIELVEEFERIRSAAERMARSGDPVDLLAAGELIKGVPGDEVVAIIERVSERLRLRLGEARHFASRAEAS